MSGHIRYDLALLISKMMPTPDERISFLRQLRYLFDGRSVTAYRDLYLFLQRVDSPVKIHCRRRREYQPSSRQCVQMRKEAATTSHPRRRDRGDKHLLEEARPIRESANIVEGYSVVERYPVKSTVTRKRGYVVHEETKRSGATRAGACVYKRIQVQSAPIEGRRYHEKGARQAQDGTSEGGHVEEKTSGASEGGHVEEKTSDASEGGHVEEKTSDASEGGHVEEKTSEGRGITQGSPLIAPNHCKLGIESAADSLDRRSNKRYIFFLSVEEVIYCINQYLPGVLAITGDAFVIFGLGKRTITPHPFRATTIGNRGAFHLVVSQHLDNAPLAAYKDFYIFIAHYNDTAYINLEVVTAEDIEHVSPYTIFFSDSAEMISIINYVIPDVISTIGTRYLVYPALFK